MNFNTHISNFKLRIKHLRHLSWVTIRINTLQKFCRNALRVTVISKNINKIISYDLFTLRQIKMFPIKESTYMTRCRDKYDGFVKNCQNCFKQN